VKERFEKIMEENVFACVGEVIQDKALKIKGINGEEILKENIDDLKDVWKAPLNF
jgi:hypothetical protein